MTKCVNAKENAARQECEQALDCEEIRRYGRPVAPNGEPVRPEEVIRDENGKPIMVERLAQAKEVQAAAQAWRRHLPLLVDLVGFEKDRKSFRWAHQYGFRITRNNDGEPVIPTMEQRRELAALADYVIHRVHVLLAGKKECIELVESAAEEVSEYLWRITEIVTTVAADVAIISKTHGKVRRIRSAK